MKRIFFSIICLAVLLFGRAGLLDALEIEFTRGVNNMTHHNYPYGIGDLHLKGEVSDKLDFDIHLSRDNILNNTLYAKIKTNTDYFNIEFGPFAGMTDNLGAPELGITGYVQFAYPGIAFLSLGGSASLGADKKFLSDNTRETYEAKIGAWLPGVIPALSYSHKNYTNRHDAIESNNKLTRAQISIDIFNKNLPVILCFNAGVETITSSYDPTYTDELTAAYAGINLKWQISKSFALIAGGEIPLVCSAKAPTTEPDNRFKLYKFSGGLTYTVF